MGTKNLKTKITPHRAPTFTRNTRSTRLKENWLGMVEAFRTWLESAAPSELEHDLAVLNIATPNKNAK